MEITPVSLKEANEFVARYHRHHKPVQGQKFSIGASKGGVLVGVAIVGRPVSRYMDDGVTLEVTRLCTDGTKNACSFLYGHAWRIAREMGYKRIVTYTLESEDGASLRAAGWTWLGGGKGGENWTGKRKREIPLFPDIVKPEELKQLWERRT